jgi:hypothetical protein
VIVLILTAGSAGAWFAYDRWGFGADEARPKAARAPRPTARATPGTASPSTTTAGAQPSALTPDEPNDAAPADAEPSDASANDAMAADAGVRDALDGDGGLDDEELTDPGPIVILPEEDDDWGLEVTATPAPPSPPIRSIRDAKAAIDEGRREDAIRGLRRLARKRPKSAYIPYLLGQLYYEKLWVTPAMEAYATAIANDRSYRKKRTIIKHAVHTLGSSIASKKAVSLFLHSIGKAGLPYLQKAAKNDRNRKVRSRAAWLVKRLKSGKKKR